MSTFILAWAISATAIAAWALWKVFHLRYREKYLTAILEGTK